MSELLIYGGDGVLRDGTRVLGCFKDLIAEDAYARVIVGGQAYDVMRKGSVGWRFRLLEPATSRLVCAFHAALLRPGGRLVGPSATTSVRSRFLHTGQWTISIAGAGRWRATRGLASFGTIDSLEGGRVQRRVFSPAGPPPLTLRGDLPPPLNVDLAATLVLACWLIVQWEMLPRGGVSGA